MIDRTVWGIVKKGPFTKSGDDEIQVRTIRRADCQIILEERYGSVGKAKKAADLVIERIVKPARTLIFDDRGTD